MKFHNFFSSLKSDSNVCSINVHNRRTKKNECEIRLKHDHSFDGLCSIDMSQYGIITTDGPHTLWSRFIRTDSLEKINGNIQSPAD